MSESRECLNALVGGFEGDLAFMFAGVHSTDAAAALAEAEAGGPVYLLPVAPTGEVLCVARVLDGTAESYLAAGRRASVILRRDGAALAVYRLTPGEDATRVEKLSEALGVPLTEPLPLAGINGWALTHADLDAEFAVGEVALQAFRVVPVGMPIWDGTVVAPLDLGAPWLAERIPLLTAPGIRAAWTRREVSRQGLMQLLSTHPEGRKDGGAIVLADGSGGARGIESITAATVMGFDLDSGHLDEAELTEMLVRSKVAFALSSTHSHFATSTELSYDVTLTRAVKDGHPREHIEDNVELLRSVVTQTKGYPDKITSEITEGGRVVIGPKGRSIIVSHAPVHKFRPVLFLKKPFGFLQEGRTAREVRDEYKRVYLAVADQIGFGAHIDRSGADLNRGFYTPRHAPGRPFFVAVGGGELIDAEAILEDLPKVASERGGRNGGGATTPNGRWLRSWIASAAGRSFDLAGLLRDRQPDLVREDRGDKIVMTCPLDHEHGNAGDPGDRAFVVLGGDGPAATCRHSHGANKDRLDWIEAMISECWLTFEDLLDEDFVQAASDNPDGDASVVERLRRTVPGFDPGVGEAVGASVRGALGVVGGEEEERITACTRRPMLEEIDKTKTYFSTVAQGLDYLEPRMVKANIEGKTRVITRGSKGYTKWPVGEVSHFYSSIKVEVEVGDKTVLKSLLPIYLSSDRVRLYDAVDCDPGFKNDAGAFNLWEGTALRPRPGKCDLMRQHLLRGTCAADSAHFRTLEQWLGHMIQHPAEKAGFAVAVNGPRGIGKSTPARWLCEMIGRRHAGTISQPKHLYGDFNSHQAGKLFMRTEELTWGGNKEREGVLKELITGETTMAEGKGIDAVEARSFVRWWFNSNEGHMLPVGPNERRFFLLTAADPCPGATPAQARAYFNALEEEAQNGGLEAWLYHLLGVDLSDFDRFRPPKTKGLADQAERSMSPPQRWLFNALQVGHFSERDGTPSGGYWLEDRALRIETADLIRSYDSCVREWGGSAGGAAAFLRVLQEFGNPKRVRLLAENGSRRPWGYELDKRATWQAAFVQRFGVTFEEGGADAGDETAANVVRLRN